MLEIGKRQTLYIARLVSFGAYLSEKDADISDADRKESILHPNEKSSHSKSVAQEKKSLRERNVNKAESIEQSEVLLPIKELPAGAKAGDAIDVFLYKDSEDRPIATLREPFIKLHEVKRLKCKQITRTGAFMDLGLEKDVLLPFSEQTKKIKEGEEVLCALYLDKSKRLCVTMNVYPYLRTDSPYGRDSEVEGTAYEDSDNFGMFVAVDDFFSALIPKKELTNDVHIGDKVNARVARVRPDGKLELSLHKKAYKQMDDDAYILESRMKAAGGVLIDGAGKPLTEKSSPELIRATLNMSKASFKRAIGKLLKDEKIFLSDEEIKLAE